jgi:hypothetical protein
MMRSASHTYPDQHSDPGRKEHMVAWDRVTRTNVLRAIQEYDRHGPEAFLSARGFAPTTTYELVWQDRSYPPKAILGTAYEFATGQRLASGDFEGEDRRREGTGKAGIHRPDAVTCQAKLHVRPCLHVTSQAPS